jgi:hypothetical protein
MAVVVAAGHAPDEGHRQIPIVWFALHLNDLCRRLFNDDGLRLLNIIGSFFYLWW